MLYYAALLIAAARLRPVDRRATPGDRRFAPSGRLEHRIGRRALTLGRLEGDLHLLADGQLVVVAIDDVGHHRRAFLERHIGDGVDLGRALHHADAVDGAQPGAFLPLRAVAEAV